MKTMTLYIAYDDTEFTDESECRAYEEKASACIIELIDAYTFYDKNKNIIFPAWGSIEEYLQWFDSTTDDCEYIKVYKSISHEAHRFLWENIGCSIPEEKGFYKYDWNTNKWASIN